jgi:hypothetical protein
VGAADRPPQSPYQPKRIDRNKLDTILETEQSSSQSSRQASQVHPLEPRELEKLADKIIEMMKRELKLEREREGKPR